MPHERRLSKDAAPGPCQHVRMMLQVTPPAADVKLGSRSTTSVSQRYLRRPSSIAPAPPGSTMGGDCRVTDTELAPFVTSLGIKELVPCSECRLYTSLGGKAKYLYSFFSMAQFNLLFC